MNRYGDWWRLRWTAYSRGIRHFRQGEHRKAISCLAAAESELSDPERRIPCLKVLAECYLKIGSYDKATGAYERALLIAPEDRDLQLALARCRIMKTDFTKAAASVMEELKGSLPCACPQRRGRRQVEVKPGRIARFRISFVAAYAAMAIWVGVTVAVSWLAATDEPVVSPSLKSAAPAVAPVLAERSQAPPADRGKKRQSAVRKKPMVTRYVHPADTIRFE